VGKYPKVNLGGAVKILFAPLKRYRGKGPTIHGMQRDRTVWLDPRSNMQDSTLVHELYHLQYPNWTEEMVMRAEEEFIAHAPWQVRAKAIRILGTARIAGKEEMP